MSSRSFARLVALVAAVTWLGTGVWALVDPPSFYRNVATFPPYNVHFLHDIGAFSVGLGLVLVLALVLEDALVAALTGVGVAAVVHAGAHFVDRHHGPDAYVPLGVVALLTLLAAVAAAREPEARR